jgi:uncharacterized Zn-binding protein involved in type VI secretion
MSMGLPAARLTDRTSHFAIIAAVAAVAGAVAGMVLMGPAGAAVGALAGAFIGAMALSIPTGVISAPCMPTVLTGFLPSARVLDVHNCAIHFVAPNVISTGAATVVIGGLPAARISDKTFCAADVSSGEPTVLIGGATVTFPFNIEGDAAFVKDVQAAMATLYSTRTGRKIIDDIAASGNTVTIEKFGGDNGSCTAHDPAGASSKGGSSSTVKWNPNYSDPLDPAQTPTIVLGHELVHATHNATGTRRTGPYDKYGKQEGSSNRGAERATVGLGGTTVVAPDGTTQTVPDHSHDVPTENSLRDDLGVPRRTSYYPSNWPGGPPW